MANTELTNEMREAFKLTIPKLLSYEIEVDNKVILVKPVETTLIKDLQVYDFEVGDYIGQFCYPLENHGFAHLSNVVGSVALWLATKM